MKNVKVVKTKTAVIILVIVIILIMLAVFTCVEKNYQKEYADFPTISIVYNDKILGDMIPVEYNWTYNGETKEYNLRSKAGIEDLEDYEFPEENVILVGNNEEYFMKSNIRYKTTSYSERIVQLPERSYNNGNGYGDMSKLLKDGMSLQWFNNVGEYLYRQTFYYKNQGFVEYATKIVFFEESQARIAKNYLDTKLEDTDKINELLTKIKFNQIYNSCKIEGNNLTVEYDYHINENSLKMNNLVLFACIPELDSITYSPKNKKTSVTYEEDENMVTENKEVEEYTYTREEVDDENLANTDNLKKYMEQI
jgi:hypothetical protein